MALQKVPVSINFSKGVDLKTDPYQVAIGNFLRLENSVFTKIGRLTKRNGFGLLTELPDDVIPDFITTFNGSLVAIGDSVYSLSAGPNKWINKGSFSPIGLETLSIARTSTNIIQCDSVVSSNGLVCTVLSDDNGSAISYKYTVNDQGSGEAVIPLTAIPSSGVVTGSPRVFVLGQYFVIVFCSVITAADNLRYCVINTANPVAPVSSTTISSIFDNSTSPAFDGVVCNNNLFIAWNGSDMGGAVRIVYLDSTLTLHSTEIITGQVATMFSVTADTTSNSPTIWVSWWDSGSEDGYSAAFNMSLDPVLAPTQTFNSVEITNLTTTAQDGVLDLFYEIPNDYSYDSIASNYITHNTLLVAGTLGSPAIIKRSVGLASKAFIYNETSYFLAVYDSPFQPTYFLLSETGVILAKLAYSNGLGYLTIGLPNATVSEDSVYIGYLLKTQVEAVSKAQDATNGSGIYAQLGANLATFSFGTKSIAAELGGSLNLTGGFPWMYDGVKAVELGFFVYPDSILVETETTGGELVAQEYFYQVVYEWTDNTGRIHRSAPSIPVNITTTGSTSTNTISVPTVRLTYKTSNPIKICIYRWSTAQQSYYQVTPIDEPLLNNPAVDSVEFEDESSDSDILGNSLIYTTGGVVENIMAPACTTATIWDSRLWLLDAENRNLLSYSKPVVEGVPVETSDLFTIYVSPTVSSQGPTGAIHCLAPLDDKIIIFKKNAIYYVNGIGPDITGNNSQYSEPTFITGTLGCDNQNSILLTPSGLMFQSDKGIWLLSRGLAYQYIGAPVEDYTKDATVLSAVNIPETTQIRFTLDSGVTLMYDYLVEQWGTFTNIPAISSTIYSGKHTYINQYGSIYQETPSQYLDGSNPVLQAFTTSWIGLAGLQGYQRIYWVNLLGTYKSPHLLNVQIAYDYNVSFSQSISMAPDNYSGTWGSDANWGSGNAWGGSSAVEQGQVQFERQRCESFRLSIDEIYDPSMGAMAGEGLSLSGITAIVGVKSTSVPLPLAKQFG